MNKLKGRILTIFTLSGIIFVLYNSKKYGAIINTQEIKDFAKIFTSIVLEAIPFIIIGSFVSAIIQIFVSEEYITKLIPRESILGYFGSALIGLIFPVCECAIIPITRRLVKKGLPIGVAVTFMLAVPIINPVVIMSTYYAFYDIQAMVILRTVGGFVGAILIGMIVSTIQKNRDCLKLNYIENDNYCNCGCNAYTENQNKVRTIFEHINREFLDIIGYLIFGAFISSGFQVIASNGGFNYISDNKILIIIFMMFLGFVLSLCSEADAFVGRSLLENYTVSGVSAFLILGPMLDLKNFIILSGTFKKSFILKLVIVTLIVVFGISSLFMISGL